MDCSKIQDDVVKVELEPIMEVVFCAGQLIPALNQTLRGLYPPNYNRSFPQTHYPNGLAPPAPGPDVNCSAYVPVSYTHLTLPTTASV